VRARFILVGDGPVRADIEQRIADYGLTDDVELVGEQHELVPWLSIADLFLLPSAQESFGLAALEAMACEVPVVASNVGGLPEIIENGVTGFVCPPEAVQEMADRGIAL
jgi:glycosyltransferase involved in cell wall biosynthesis